MDFKIAVLAGDGIGPEISAVGVDVMTAVCEKFGHKVSYEYAVCGADAIDKVGDPFPEATYQACKNADAVLFSAVGDPKFDNDPTAKVRPEQGLLAMRKKLGLFANIRPAWLYQELAEACPLKKEIIGEPLLTPIQLQPYLQPQISRVTVGGESGEQARLCRWEWVTSLAAQCRAANVPFVFKQTGTFFEKGGLCYKIPRALQHAQAQKAMQFL